VQTYATLLYVRLFHKNGTQNESEDVFLGGSCLNLVVFGQFRINLGKKSYLKHRRSQGWPRGHAPPKIFETYSHFVL